VARFDVLPRHLLGRNEEKNMKNLNEDSQCPSLDSKERILNTSLNRWRYASHCGDTMLVTFVRIYLLLEALRTAWLA
jgi:hypothetical protein